MVRIDFKTIVAYDRLQVMARFLSHMTQEETQNNNVEI